MRGTYLAIIRLGSRALRTKEMGKTQSDHTRLNLLSLVTWSRLLSHETQSSRVGARAFWPAISVVHVKVFGTDHLVPLCIKNLNEAKRWLSLNQSLKCQLPVNITSPYQWTLTQVFTPRVYTVACVKDKLHRPPVHSVYVTAGRSLFCSDIPQVSRS